MSAKITLMGIDSVTENLFEFLYNNELIDAETLKNEILLQAGEFEVMYASWIFNKSLIGHITKSYKATFDRWVTAINLEYNPIENYDRVESWTDTGESNSSSTGASHDLDKVSSYDSDVLRDNTESVGTNSSDASGSVVSTHNGRVHGNIGVTTSQQMIQSELELAKFNVIEKIAEVYVDKLCIKVY